FANVLVMLSHAFNILISKPLYVFILIFGTANIFTKHESAAFLTIAVFFAISGAIINSNLFEPSKDKFYALNLLRMDARKYTLSNYFYFLAKTFIGQLIGFLIFGLICKLPVFICILLPFFTIFAKVTYVALMLSLAKKGKGVFNENKPTPLYWCLIAFLLVAPYALCFFDLYINSFTFLIIFAVLFFAFIFAFIYVINFKEFKKIYKHLLTPTNIVFDASSVNKMVKDTVQKQMETGVIIKSNKKGFAYFHDIFVSRHRKILTKSTKSVSLVLLVTFAALLLAMPFVPKMDTMINKFIMQSLPYFVFIMYAINRGQALTQAMFINCDHSMLSYNFYRQPKSILTLFTLRLKTLVTINLIPAFIIGLGLALLLYASGGTENSLNYLVIFVSIISISIFFSVHNLILYYLLQPYTSEIESKSIAYNIITNGTYFVAFCFINIKLPTFAFGCVTTVFALVYVAVSLMLVYRLAPKTFKLR
ncbi:MAG: hypothetical protein RR902_03500, partial [Oscillospiraceae bacterium]